MQTQISVYIRIDQAEKLEKVENKSKVVRKALDQYFKNQKEEKEMKIIDIVELNENGISVKGAGKEFATRYFDDNGGLPDGNYDENNISGWWVLLGGKHTEFDLYAYRSIDDSTLVPLDGFRENLIANLWQGKYGNDIADTLAIPSSWVQENDELVYDSLLDMLEEFAAEDTNTCSKEDVEKFRAGDWVVEYIFREGGIAYTAGRDSQHIANQPEWFEDEWKDVPPSQLVKYHNQLDKQRN